jgi:hypothetical protein
MKANYIGLKSGSAEFPYMVRGRSEGSSRSLNDTFAIHDEFGRHRASMLGVVNKSSCPVLLIGVQGRNANS